MFQNEGRPRSYGTSQETFGPSLKKEKLFNRYPVKTLVFTSDSFGVVRPSHLVNEYVTWTRKSYTGPGLGKYGKGELSPRNDPYESNYRSTQSAVSPIEPNLPMEHQIPVYESETVTVPRSVLDKEFSTYQ